MQVYCLGDECETPSESSFVWYVYDYWEGSYEGGGHAVGLGIDGLLSVGDLGHCSCYGPMEVWSPTDMTIDEFFRPKDSVHDYDCPASIVEKVRELLGR